MFEGYRSKKVIARKKTLFIIMWPSKSNHGH